MFYLPAVRVLLPACALLLLTGCQAQSLPLPESEKLSAEKVAQIATTIDQTYPKLSIDIRTQLLNTVVQSLDNMVFVEGGEFQMGDFGWKCNYDPRETLKKTSRFWQNTRIPPAEFPHEADDLR